MYFIFVDETFRFSKMKYEIRNFKIPRTYFYSRKQIRAVGGELVGGELVFLILPWAPNLNGTALVGKNKQKIKKKQRKTRLYLSLKFFLGTALRSNYTDTAIYCHYDKNYNKVIRRKLT
jgi:hypothetical protein